MPTWGDRLKSLFGGKPAKRPRRQGPSGKSSKTYAVSTTDRAEVIKEAMAVYRSRRGEMRGLLDKALAEMREKPPKTVSEHDKLVRLLALHRANVGLKTMMSHDLRQYLVLAGIRGLLEGNPGTAAPPKPIQGASGGKTSQRKISTR